MKLLIYLLLTLMYSFNLIAESTAPKIVVSSSKIERSYSDVASSVTIITEQEIEASGKKNVIDLLKTVPSIDIAQNGALGGNAAVFIRGANSEHTLIVIDGIEVNNPANNARAFNFANLTLANIERIEIIRGPQASIYGSDAIGGVISIITKKGTGDPTFYASFEAGSFQTFNESAGISIGNQDTFFTFDLIRQDSDNISAADTADGNLEDDSYQNTELSARAGTKLNDQVSTDFVLRYQNSNADIDDFGGSFGDDVNRKISNEKLFTKGQVNLNSFNKTWEQKFALSYSDHQLKDRDFSDPAHPIDIVDSNFHGKLTKFSWQNFIDASDEIAITFGVETEKEEASENSLFISDFGEFTSSLNDKDARTNAYYLEALFDILTNFSIATALRLDDHSQFGTNFNYRIAPNYLIEATDTRVAATVGTAFKAPSLFQLFSDFGNQTLKAEESFGWDLTLEQELSEDSSIGITYYQNKIDDLITFDNATFIFENIGEVKTEGFETFIKVNPIDDLNFILNYTYTDTNDETSEQSLLRRARNKFSLRTDYKLLNQKLLIGNELILIGKRFDQDFAAFPVERVKLPSYFLVNFNLNYDLTEEIALTARIENLLDRDYQEVFGFGTRGFTVLGGIKIKL